MKRVYIKPSLDIIQIESDPLLVTSVDEYDGAFNAPLIED